MKHIANGQLHFSEPLNHLPARGYFLSWRKSSGIHRIKEVAAIIISQSEKRSGTTLKKLPPNSTIMICPPRINVAMIINHSHPLRWRAERRVSNARALNMFQN